MCCSNSVFIEKCRSIYKQFLLRDRAHCPYEVLLKINVNTRASKGGLNGHPVGTTTIAGIIDIYQYKICI